jgi:alanyl aminopeptidase
MTRSWKDGRACALVFVIALALSFAVPGSSAAATAGGAPPGELGRDARPTFEAVRLELDPRQKTYRGSVRIELEVARATKEIRFHAEEMTLANLALTGAAGAIPVTRTAGANGLQTLAAAEPIAPGSYVLAMDFENEFNTQATSLYRLDSRGDAYAFTQLEADDGREAFPCFDEPAFKHAWQLTLVVPEADSAVANTPLESVTSAHGKRTIVFRRSPPMPVYIVALAVGPFDVVPVPESHVPMRVIAPKGQGPLTAEAARAAPRLLKNLERWFGRPYPYEKLDIIGVPEYWPGAMENAGLITFADNVLLFDATTATAQKRKQVASFLAHEIAHMWFGDLVTMEWWDDLWLNESFASWMGEKILHETFPEYGTDLTLVVDSDEAMGVDGKITSRAIRQPVTTLDNLLQSADALAYEKGQSVLGMFERWLGPEPFQKGVRLYLERHAWGNATADDLWQALEDASGRQVGRAMATFLNQPGLGLVEATPQPGGRVELTQRRFLPEGVSAGRAQSWIVPVTLRYAHAGGVSTKTVLLEEPKQTFDLGAKDVTWVYPNGDAWGYYRWTTTPANWDAILAHAAKSLAPRERSEVVYDARALLEAGALHADAYLATLQRFLQDEHPSVVVAALDGLASVKGAFVTEELEEPFSRYLRASAGPALARIGWTPRPGESDAAARLRPRLLSLLADEGRDPAVRAFGDSLARAYLADPASVPPELAGAGLGIAALDGDAALQGTYRARFEAAQNPSERRLFLSAIGAFYEPERRQEALAYALDGPLRPQEIGVLYGNVQEQTPRTPDVVLEWMTRNYDRLRTRIPPMYAAFLPYVAAGCSTPRLEKGKAFFSDPKHSAPGMDVEIAKVSAQVDDCVRLRAREGERAAAFLRRAASTP